MNKRYDNGNTQVLSPNPMKVQVLPSAPNTTATGYVYYDLALGLGTYASGGWNYGGGGTNIALTTTGTSGAATLVSGTLNIPVYSGASESVAIVNWVVTTSGGSFPNAGATTYTNAAISGARAVLVWRNRLKDPAFNPGDGSSYYTISGSTITFSTALATGELIDITILS